MKTILSTHKHVLSIILLIVIALFSQGCEKDEKIGDRDIIIPPSRMEIVLPLNILNQSDAASRATSPATAAELEIKSLHFFLFDEDGVCKLHDLINTPGEVSASIKDNSTSNPIITLNLTSLVTIERTDDVVLVLNQTPLSTDYMTFLKEDLDSQFALSSDTGFYPTPVEGDNAIVGVPMYGEVKGAAFGTPASSSITITRAVAKLQVKLHPGIEGDASAGTNSGDRVHFTPDKVTYQIYQNAITGNITTPLSPATLSFSYDNKAPISTIDDIDAINKEVVLSTHAGADKSTIGASYIYEFPYSTSMISTDADADINNSIVASNIYKVGRLAIILKVQQENAADFLYYNLSLYNKATGQYLDVKRNHNYQLIIHSVKDGAGYTTAAEALISPTTNVEFDIIDNKTGSTTISNGEYAISIGAQPYVGETIYLNQFEEFSEFDLTDEVRYILSPTLAALPSGLVNKITVTPSALDEDVTIRPTTLTDKTERLILRVPKDYEGTIDFSIKLGELEYNSKDTELQEDGTKYQPMTIGDWRDNPDGSGNIGSSLIFPKLVIMDNLIFPNYSYTSDSVKYSGSGGPVNIFLPSNTDGTTWGEAVTESDFQVKFEASTKPTWLKRATFEYDNNLACGHFTFTYAHNSSEDLYKIKLQSRGVTRIMTITPVNGELTIGEHPVSFIHQPMIYHEGTEFKYPVYTGGGATKWGVVLHTGFAETLDIHTPVLNASEKSLSGDDISFTIPANTKLDARSATITLARDEEGQEGYKTITLLQEGEPSFTISKPLRLNYYDNQPHSFRISIGDASERDKYTWVATREFEGEDIGGDDDITPLNSAAGVIVDGSTHGYKDEVLSLSSNRTSAIKGARAVGYHDDILTITPSERAWRHQHYLGNVKIRLVRKATSSVINTHMKSVDFRASTPDLIFDTNNAGNILNKEVYHEIPSQIIHRIRTGSSVIGWSGSYTTFNMGSSPFTVTPRSGADDTSITINIPVTPNSLARKGIMTISRVESGYTRARTITFSQEGKPSFTHKLRPSYYANETVQFNIAISNSVERAKYTWVATRSFGENPPATDAFADEVLSLSSSASGSAKGATTTGSHNSLLTITTSNRQWSDAHYLGNVTIKLVRTETGKTIETDHKDVDFRASTPNIIFDDDNAGNILHEEVFHEATDQYIHRIRTGSSVIRWSGRYTNVNMGSSPFTVTPTSGVDDSKITITIPTNPNLSARNGTMTISRVESGYNRDKTIKFSQEGRPTLSSPLRDSYYAGDAPVNLGPTIQNPTERSKYGWRATLTFDDATTPNDNTILELLSSGNNSGNGSFATGLYSNQFSVKAPSRIWSAKEITGVIQMELVRTATSVIIDAGKFSKAFTVSTPDIMINGSADDFEYFAYHEGRTLPVHTIQTGNSKVKWRPLKSGNIQMNTSPSLGTATNDNTNLSITVPANRYSSQQTGRVTINRDESGYANPSFIKVTQEGKPNFNAYVPSSVKVFDVDIVSMINAGSHAKHYKWTARVTRTTRNGGIYTELPSHKVIGLGRSASNSSSGVHFSQTAEGKGGEYLVINYPRAFGDGTDSYTARITITYTRDSGADIPSLTKTFTHDINISHTWKLGDFYPIGADKNNFEGVVTNLSPFEIIKKTVYRNNYISTIAHCRRLEGRLPASSEYYNFNYITKQKLIPNSGWQIGVARTYHRTTQTSVIDSDDYYWGIAFKTKSNDPFYEQTKATDVTPYRCIVPRRKK